MHGGQDGCLGSVGAWVKTMSPPYEHSDVLTASQDSVLSSPLDVLPLPHHVIKSQNFTMERKLKSEEITRWDHQAREMKHLGGSSYKGL